MNKLKQPPRIRKNKQPIAKFNNPFRKSKQPFRKSKQPFPKSKQPFPKSKQPFQKSKQPFPKSKQPFLKSKQPFLKSKQPFRKSKQPFRKSLLLKMLLRKMEEGIPLRQYLFMRRKFDFQRSISDFPAKYRIRMREEFIRSRRQFYIGSRDQINYKNIMLISRFIGFQGKIIPRRVTKLTLRQQRLMTSAIKKARILCLLPFFENELYAMIRKRRQEMLKRLHDRKNKNKNKRKFRKSPWKRRPKTFDPKMDQRPIDIDPKTELRIFDPKRKARIFDPKVEQRPMDIDPKTESRIFDPKSKARIFDPKRKPKTFDPTRTIDPKTENP